MVDKNLFTVSKKLKYHMLQKLFTLMHQCMGGGHSVKEFQQEDHGLTRKELAYKCSRMKIHSFKSHVNCQGSCHLREGFF